MEPWLENSESAIYNNTINMINSEVAHGLSTNISVVAEQNILDEEEKFFLQEEASF